MSLINQMLKDLAKRNRPALQADALLSGLVVSYGQTKKNKLPYWLLLSCLLLMMFIGLFLYFYPVKTPTTILKPLPKVHFHNSNEHPNFSLISPVPYVKEPVNLTGITFQAEKDSTNLRLLLTQKTPYRITGNGDNRIAIVLENTRLVSTLPQIDTVNSAIKLLQVLNQVDGSLKIIFKLNPEAELTHLELIEKDQLPELQVDLLHKNTAVQALSQPKLEASVKKITRDGSVLEEYEQAMHFVNEGLISNAVAELSSFLLKYPDYIPARKSLIALLIKQGETTKALTIVDRGLEQHPLYAPFIQLKAQILVNTDKVRDALHLLQKVAPEFEANPDYYAFLAALYQRQNQSAFAEKIYERLVNLQPSNSIWWMGLAIACESINKKAEALEAYQKANMGNLSPELKVYTENRIHALL